jgi:replicative DNA helicase
MAVEKLLPQNVEAEAGVLGSLLIDPDAIFQVSEFLHPDDFYRDSHRTIFEAVVDLYEAGGPTDLITLTDELARRDKLEEIGGAGFLSSLANQVPTSANVEYYARIVERTATLRRLIHAAGQIAGIAYNEPEAATALDEAERLIFSVSQRYVHDEFEHIRDTLRDYIDKLDQLHENRGSLVGIPTGFNDLDKITGGLQKSDLIILAARPSLGKTAMALSLAHNTTVKHKNTVALFSLEMSKEQLVARILSMDAMVDSQRLRNGYIDDDEWERISESVGRLSEANIYIDDTPGISLAEMRSKARRLMLEQGFDLLIVDYLQLMQGSGGGIGHENRVQQISEISRGLKILARELNVPVLALSQLSRAVESRNDKHPQLSDLRESGCLAGETLIYLPDEGVYRRIDQLVGQSGFNVLALNTQTWKLESRPALRAFATGHKPVFRMTTRLGRTIRATANHQFLTIAGWRRLDELAPESRIALPRILSGPETPTMRHEELALLGHLIGDGCTLPRHVIQYTTNDRELAETVAQLATLVFGDAVRPRIKTEREWYQVYLSATAHLTHRVRTPVAGWLEELGVFGLRSYEKHVPKQVFQQPAAGIAVFLRHLWATDGMASCHPKYALPTIYYASSSPRLARDVQALLLRLGINAKVFRVPQPGKGRDQYHVDIGGKPNQERFITQIGVAGERKQHMLDDVRRHLAEHGTKAANDVIPRELWPALVLPAMQAAGLTNRQVGTALGYVNSLAGISRQNLSRARAERIAQATGSAELSNLAQSDVYWDEVVSIEPDGEAEVYDLTVDGLHCFVAGEILAHNSIEQDADIVMFIYRDEVYNPETTDRPNIADIIVAKHRNGPVGQISLYFQAAQTRYRDLELRVPSDY